MNHSANAKRMHDAANEAGDVAMKALQDYFDSSDLSIKNQIGATIVAVSNVYGSILTNMISMGLPPDAAKLAMGAFQHLVSPSLAKIMEISGGGAIINVDNPNA